MRGSFGGIYGIGGSGGAGGGGGGSGSGGMLRTMGTVARRTRMRGLHRDPYRSSSCSSPRKSSANPNSQKRNPSSKHGVSLSSSSSSRSNNGTPVSGAPWLNQAYFASGTADYCQFDQWECVENYDDCDAGFVDHVFGCVPSHQEVEHALLSLQQVIHPISSSRFTNSDTSSDIDKDDLIPLEKGSSTSSEIDWIEPSVQIYDQRYPSSSGLDRVYDAFHLLQTEPSVKRMVVSLSTDQAVWDAVMNNEAVREIRESYFNAEPSPVISEEDSDPADANPKVLKWIFDNMKAKLMEAIRAITNLLGEMFNRANQDKQEHSDSFSEKLKSSFLLTIMVLLIVVVARGHKA